MCFARKATVTAALCICASAANAQTIQVWYSNRAVHHGEWTNLIWSASGAPAGAVIEIKLLNADGSPVSGHSSVLTIQTAQRGAYAWFVRWPRPPQGEFCQPMQPNYLCGIDLAPAKYRIGAALYRNEADYVYSLTPLATDISQQFNIVATPPRAPTVTFSAASGAAGSTLKIWGKDFAAQNAVAFGQFNSVGWVPNATGNLINYVVPCAATVGSYSVTLSNTWGQAAPFTYSVTSEATCDDNGISSAPR